eukprot:CAMPEP_0197434992 /NCGR_PEP_ID=MMETSP1175-20131217/2650_1 /TAXON_ID=1003142 /ORGANISM="Triceratium dubium, Strain CCMP147" /LENGTH=565 /DNA_ID=CAMNT_0042963901 /DNA_START=144 /DNA_END=1841 /DNA_ORIENTATION=+
MALSLRTKASLTPAVLGALLVVSGQNCDEFNCHHGATCADGDADYGLVATFPYMSTNFLDVKSYKGQHCVCPEEWSGVACKRKVTICGEEEDQFACFHGSKCVELGSDAGSKWGCDCTTAKWMGEKEFFSGLHCEYRSSDVCATQDEDGLEEGRWFCANGGVCNNEVTEVMKKCDCPKEWFGPHCEYARGNNDAWANYKPSECSLKCRNGGKCVFGQKDYGAHGNKNDATVAFTNETHQDGMHCVCPDGFTGLICQIPAKKCGNRLWCYNGAECQVAEMQDGTSRKYCDCAPGSTDKKAFAGLACQHQSGVFCNPDEGNRKDMAFCVNSGTCWEDGEQHLGCDCKDGWTGQHCEFHSQHDPEELVTEECKLKCNNGGQCQKGVKDYGTVEKYDVPFKKHRDFEHCTCPEGWTGLDCSVKIEFCSPNSRQVCFYGSTCVATGEISANGKDEYKCECDQGKTPEGASVAGRYCEHYATDICTDSAVLDWHSFCVNGGTCVNSNVAKDEAHPGCFCKGRWTGDYCERKDRTADGEDDGLRYRSSAPSSNVVWTTGTAAALASLVAMAL